MAATFKRVSNRVPAKVQESYAGVIKKAHRLSESKLSLKKWARQQKDDVLVIQVQAWFHNKKANFKKPELCLGRTRQRVKRGGPTKGADRDMTGR